MSAAAFKGVALFLWSRNRRSFVIQAAIYALLFIGSEALSLEQSRSSLFPMLLLLPLVLPLTGFIGSELAANPDLTSPEGLFPRHFFVLPAAARHIVLPFMLYAALFAAAQWILAVVISDGRLLDLTTGRLWLPFFATSFVAWMQALMWTPVRHRFVRAMQLLSLLSVYIFVLVESLNAMFSRELTIALSMAQFPIAYAVAVHGVAKCRRGEPSPRVAKDRDHPASTSVTRWKRGMPHLASPLDAQLWMERRIHRWAGKSALVALIPAVLLIVLFIAMLSGADESNPEGLQFLGAATIVLLFIALGIIGLSTGVNFGSFRSRIQWNQADAYQMPPYFAALPFATGDFAWAKMRAATQRMLWVSAGVVLTCAAVAKISGFSDAWIGRHAEWRDEYGLAATLALAALPSISVVMLVLSATASVMWVALQGRLKAVVPLIVLISVMLLFVISFAGRPHGAVPSVLPDIIRIAAVVKLCGLATLVFYVGSRRILSWGRLAAITGFWAATAGTLVAWLTWYAPQGLISPMTTLCVGIVVAPVLGAVAAPAALGWNRVR